MFHNGEREAVETTGMIDLQNGPMIRGQKLSLQSEEAFYAALELNFVPVEREMRLKAANARTQKGYEGTLKD